MAKLFLVVSWNVEHFKGDPSRVARVVDFLASHDPDIFALLEVEGATVFQTLVDKMPGYTFQITEGLQTQEILVGVKRDITAFITQKTEFRAGTTHMRPGQLVTVTVNGTNYSILFLHVASGVNPRGMGLRDDMMMRAIDFRRAIAAQDVAMGGDGDIRYLFLGDLNSMGLEYPFDRDISAALELRNWDETARRKQKNKMRRLTKTFDATWSNGSGSSIPDSNLDHVYATEKVKFESLTGANGQQAQVDVRGWTKFEGNPAKKDDWISDFSDHSLIYLEVSA